MDIGITLNNDQTSSIDMEYVLVNKSKNTVQVTLGVPEHEVEFKNFYSWVSPYEYRSTKVKGDTINSQIPNLKREYTHWRIFSTPFKEGEERIARVSYNVDNHYLSEGRTLISFLLDHIRTWEGNPKVNVSVFFDSNEVKVYNFGKEFSIQPQVDDKLNLRWTLDRIDGEESIDFDYFSVDYEIIKFLKAQKSSRIQRIVTAYERKDYTEVVDLGKEYIKNPENDQLQKEIYFIMADAYLQVGQPEESLVIYQLIESESMFYQGIQDKVQDFIIFNRVNGYLETEDYKTLYRLLATIIDNDNYSFIFQDWAKKQVDRIPREIVDQVIQEDRVPEGFEKILLDIQEGKYNTSILVIFGILFVVLPILHSIRKKKRDKKFLFRK